MHITYLEYIWLDGYKPQNLRSKTKVVYRNIKDNIEKIKNQLINDMESDEIPVWNFDGSSTSQAETSKSELILKPCNIFINPFLENSFLVLCEVFNIDGTPHESNKRSELRKMLKYDDKVYVSFEQEYFIYDVNTNLPLGWKIGPDGFNTLNGEPRSQGEFYCGVGGLNVVGREFSEKHMIMCNEIGLRVDGTNMEVAYSQLEYQLFGKHPLEGSDEFWISRYILFRLAEKFNYKINLDPKPFPGNDINGSGCHVNFSTKKMREDLKNKKSIVIDACKALQKRAKDHIAVYGKNNEKRLTGANETCSINEFRYGIGDRTASIRIPSSINNDTTPGYLEDRRPASNINPYEVVSILIETICKK